MHRRINQLPPEFQLIYEEFKLQKDIEDAIKQESVKTYPTNDEVMEEYQQLDSVIEEENESDYDEHDENTYDMNAVSCYMKDAFDN
jgi:hypothetical protein